eukprot:Nitzschia sp. Nitz4//scaffold22_size323478//93249//96655//NITZ4_000516-RA/size323478-augustus-gene-0.195-mRNA-1//1//CDS//3329542962//8580//frame0
MVFDIFLSTTDNVEPDDDSVQRLVPQMIRSRKRAEHRDMMAGLFEQAMAGHSSAVIIEADSGTGKSCFVESFVNEVARAHNSKPVIAMGKFEERTAASEPFAATVSVVSDIIREILLRSPDEDWMHQLSVALDGEIHLLLEVIPSLYSLVKKHPAGIEISDDDGHCSTTVSSKNTEVSINFEAFGDMSKQEWRFQRFCFAFRGMIRLFAARFPMVIVMDNLHFAERDSLLLIQSLICDGTPERKLLVVGATRPVMDEDHSIRAILDKNNSRRGFPAYSLVLLPPFGSEEIAQLLNAMLKSADASKIDELAYIIETQTGGNAFLVDHFIRYLVSQGMFSPAKDATWEFDTQTIMAEARSFETVEEVVVTRLKSLDEHQRALLIAAASFQVSQFEVKMLVQALIAMAESGEEDEGGAAMYSPHEFEVRMSTNSCASILRESVESGFVVPSYQPGHFQFSHDRIREAAYSLLPVGYERVKFHLRIGRQLRRWMETEAEFGTTLTDDTLLMHAAKQLHRGSEFINDTWERRDVAELNFHAAEIAAKKTSFYPSMTYLKNGLQGLGRKAWTEHYDMALKLSIALSRIQYCCGLYDDCVETADEVIMNAKRFEDKKIVCHQKLLCLLDQEKHLEGVDMALSLLDGFGYPVPSKRCLTINIFRQFMRCQKFMSRVSDDDIREMPDVTDPAVEAAVDNEAGILTRIVNFTFFAAPAIYLSYCLVRSLDLWREVGNHALTAPWALQTWAWIEIMQGNIENGQRFGLLSVEMAEKYCGTTHQGFELRVKCANYVFVTCWCKPPRPTLRPLFDGWRSVLHLGEMDVVQQDGGTILRHKFAAGAPLKELESDLTKFLEVLQDYRQRFLWIFSAPVAQAVSNFINNTTNPSVLLGRTLNTDTLLEMQNSKASGAMTQYHLFSMILNYHFGNFDRAASFERELPKDLFGDCAEFMVAHRVFYTTLTYIELSQRTSTRRRRNRRLARRAMTQLKTWVKKGATNCEYMYLLADARHSSTTMKHSDDILNKYDKAIKAVSSLGVLHHEALANELACDTLVTSGNFELAHKYLIRSIDLYTQWQGMAKVHELKTRYSHALTERVQEVGVKAPVRMTFAGSIALESSMQ